jgi:hypothetical protein
MLGKGFLAECRTTVPTNEKPVGGPTERKSY